MPKENQVFEFGPFRLEVRERRLTRDGHSVALRGRVFDTLLSLVTRHGCLVTKDELMAAVWPETVVEETNLNHNICVLRRALGEKATGQKYVETVPRQGYRFVADVRELEETGASSFPDSRGIPDVMSSGREATEDASTPPLEAEPQVAVSNRKRGIDPPLYPHWNQQRAVIALVVIAACVAVGYLGAGRLGLTGNRPGSRVMLAVLPFENLTGDSAQKYVADGLSHEIIAELGRWNPVKLGVISHTSSSVYQGRQKPIREIGHELGVDYIVEGSVRRRSGRFRITVMLVRVDNQSQVWAANYDQEFDDVTALQVETTRIIIREIGSRIDVKPREESRIVDPRDFDDSLNRKNRSTVENSQSSTYPREKLIYRSQPYTLVELQTRTRT